MDNILLLVYVLGGLLIYASNRNIFAFTSLQFLNFLPAMASTFPEVGILFAVGSLCQGLGALTLNKYCRFVPKKELKEFREAPVKGFLRLPKVVTRSVLLLVLLVVCTASYYFVTVGVALFTDEVGYTRLILKEEAGGWVVNRLIRTLFPILTLIYVLVGTNGRWVRKWMVVSVMIILNAAMIAFTGFRGNIIIFIFFPFLFLTGFMKGRSRVKLLMFLVPVVAIGTLLVTYRMMGQGDIGLLVQVLWSRWTEQALGGINYVVFELIPSHGFFWGRTFAMDVASVFYKLGLMRDEILNFTAYVSREILGSRYINEQASTFLEGELYANFGLGGVTVGTFLWGVVLQWVYVRTVRAGKDAVLLPFLVMYQNALNHAWGGPFLSILIDYTIHISLLFALVVGTYCLLSLPSGRIRVSSAGGALAYGRVRRTEHWLRG